MRILYLTPGCFDKGGVSRYSRYQINALRETYGDENVKVISLFSADDNAIEVEFAVSWSGSGAGRFSKMAFSLKTLLLALSWRPHVIHVAHLHLSGLAYYIARLTGAKTMLNIYGREVWTPMSKSAHVGFKQSDRLISDCHFTANYTVDSGIRAKEDIDIVWDCIDSQQFRKTNTSAKVIAEYGLPEKEGNFIIGTLGRLSYNAAHKGYDRLINVVSELAADGHTNIRLIIAGRGDMVEHLQELTNDAGIADIVTFTGAIHEEDMPAMYSYLDVFSLVSDRGTGRGEGIPLTPLEAMGCGVPIIVGNQDGSQEAVVDGSNGYVVDPFDLDAHKQCILELLNNSQTYSDKTSGALKIAHDVFSFENFKDKTIASYAAIDE